MTARNGVLDVYFNALDITLDVEEYFGTLVLGVFADSDFLYLGYRKPINAIHAYLTNLNTNSSVLSVEYYNGSAFTDVVDLKDRSRGFSRSGFIDWSRNQTDEAKTTVNSIEQYWYRLSVDADTTTLTFNSINLFFSDDTTIREEAPYLLDTEYYPENEISWTLYHQAARNEIIQRLRNEGHSTWSISDTNALIIGSRFNDITIFDLLDYTQLTTASKYLVLSKIFFFLSDSNEDKYYQKYEDYMKLYNGAFRTFFLSIDVNDDGKQDIAERGSFKSGLIIRV